MTFEKILVGLDGSRNSQFACQWAFWFATKLAAKLSGLYVNDPRFDDLFIEPEFAEELGFRKFVESSETVSKAFHQIGSLILDFFAREAEQRSLTVTKAIKQGQIVEELVSYSANYDLLIVGHRSPDLCKLPVQSLLGSVSESTTMQARLPVLLAMNSPNRISEFVVGYDGSETSREALLMTEELAKLMGRGLRALCVAEKQEDLPSANAAAEEGQTYLRESWEYPVFSVKVGPVSQTIVNVAQASNALAVVGARGISGGSLDVRDANSFGGTALELIKQDHASVLIYKPSRHLARATGAGSSAVDSA